MEREETQGWCRRCSLVSTHPGEMSKVSILGEGAICPSSFVSTERMCSFTSSIARVFSDPRGITRSANFLVGSAHASNAGLTIVTYCSRIASSSRPSAVSRITLADSRMSLSKSTNSCVGRGVGAFGRLLWSAKIFKERPQGTQRETAGQLQLAGWRIP
jgi:hypothetical protein